MALKLSVLDKKSSISSKQKCKNLLVSVLSPASRKSEKKKKLHHAASFQNIETSSIEERYDRTSNNPGSWDNYSASQELHLSKTSAKKSSTESSPLHFDVDSKYDEVILPSQSSKSLEPLYATITKKNEKDIAPEIPVKIVTGPRQRNLHQSSEELIQQDSLKEKPGKSHQETLKSEKIKILQERLKETSEENKKLRKHIEIFLKEEQRKEDTAHAKFQLKLTEFEAETRKDVECLTQRIQILVNEREILSEQVQILHEEKKASELKYDAIYKKMKNLIPPEQHEKAIAELKKLLDDCKTKNAQERQQQQEKHDVLEEKYHSLMIQIQELQEQKKLLEQKTDQLKSSEDECQKEKHRILSQLEESKQMEKESQILVQSLLKAAESVVNERDALLNKSSYQDQQQKLMHSTIVNYSLNLGRLEEHVTNLSRNKSEEIMKSKVDPLQIESMKQSYVQEIDYLRSKVLNQSNFIRELENDKRKLESQFESILQAVCIGKPKLFDEVNNMNFLNT